MSTITPDQERRFQVAERALQSLIDLEKAMNRCKKCRDSPIECVLCEIPHCDNRHYEKGETEPWEAWTCERCALYSAGGVDQICPSCRFVCGNCTETMCYLHVDRRVTNRCRDCATELLEEHKKRKSCGEEAERVTKKQEVLVIED